MQSKSAPSRWRVGRLKKEQCTWIPRPQALIGSADMGVVSPGKLGSSVIKFQNLGYVSSNPPSCPMGEFVA
jgi:hypothetical protein